jgi:hypothetical protein
MKPKERGIKKRRRPLAVPNVPDPMQGVEIPEDATRGQEAKIVLDAASKAIRDARAHEQAIMTLTQDADFYCVLVFDSRDQKKAFLAGMRKKYALHFPGDIYLDGRLLADALGIEIPEVKTKMPGLFRIDKKLAAIAMPIPKKIDAASRNRRRN